MKSPLRALIPAASISAAIAYTACGFGFRGADPLDAKATDTETALLTSKILENSQIAHQQLDDKLAAKFLDRYLDTLDAAHLVFLQTDIDEFKKSLPQLATVTRDGDTTLAHSIFKRYLSRLDERVAYVAKKLEEGNFDFTSDDSFAYDRKKAPHPADLAAAKSLWQQQLRYEYLQEKLAGKKEPDITKTLSRRSSRIADTMRKFDERAVLELYLEALAQVYDPHSDYFGAEQAKSFQIAMNLSLTGIGATLRSADGFCKIENLVPGGPAERSGLIKAGDRIVGVSQKEGDEFTDVIDMPLPKAVEMIRGKKGTPVILNLIPASAADDSIRKTITIVRDEVKLEESQAKGQILDLPNGDKTQRIGVIDLPAFYAGEGTAKAGPTSCTADVLKILNRLKQENITGLILDLRRNGGGSLQEAIDLTGLFIPKGPVVQTRNLEGRTEVGIDHDPKVAYDGPLIVLTSRLSASASEILAGALQDYGRAVIVGDSSTFGKGTVQTLIPLAKLMQEQGLMPGSDPGQLKVTISKFYRPSGKSTQLEGVKSDITLPSITDTPEISESDLGNPLPWDTIAPAIYDEADRVAKSLAPLRAASSERIAKSPDFADLKSVIARYKKMREDKTVSLNEAKRKKEKEELKAIDEAAKKARLARAIKPPLAYEVTVQNATKPELEIYKPKKPTRDLSAEDDEAKDEDKDADKDATPSTDLILQEAQKILLDYTKFPAATVAAKE
jgi:carboxyl-terminal processing protease